MMHKIINGEKVFLTKEEEDEILKEWENNDVEYKERLKKEEEKEKRKLELKKKISESLNITIEDLNLIIK